MRFPRIKRWREDKPYREADTLENLKRLINLQTSADLEGSDNREESVHLHAADEQKNDNADAPAS